MILSSHKPQLSVEVVINRCYGGFSLSQKAEKLYFSKLADQYYPGYVVTQHICHQDGGGLFLTALVKRNSDTYNHVIGSNMSYDEANTFFHENDDVIMCHDIGRSDPLLLETVKELGLEESSGPHSKLEIEQVLVSVEVRNKCDGMEDVGIFQEYV